MGRDNFPSSFMSRGPPDLQWISLNCMHHKKSMARALNKERPNDRWQSVCQYKSISETKVTLFHHPLHDLNTRIWNEERDRDKYVMSLSLLCVIVFSISNGCPWMLDRKKEEKKKEKKKKRKHWAIEEHLRSRGQIHFLPTSISSPLHTNMKLHGNA